MSAAATEPPVVAFALGALSGGGAERVVLDLLRDWPARPAKPLLLLSRRTGALCAQLPSEVTVVETGIRATFRSVLADAARIDAVVRTHGLTHCFCHDPWIARAFLRTKALGRVDCDVIPVEHVDFFNKLATKTSSLRQWIVEREIGGLHRLVPRVVFVSDGIRDDFAHRFPHHRAKYETIVNPVDVAAITERADETPSDDFAARFARIPRPRIVCAARLEPHKGFDVLLAALARLRARASLVILGEGGAGDEIRRMATALGVEDRVFLGGFVANPHWYVRRSDVFALASRREGYPLVLNEALALGVRVVATDCTFGPREIVREPDDGYLVPVDDAAAFAHRLDQVLAEGGRRSDAAEIRRRFASQTPAAVARAYARLVPGGERGG